MRYKVLLLASAVRAVLCTTACRATELKLLTAGAFKSTVMALLPEYEKMSGNKVSVENDTAGCADEADQGRRKFRCGRDDPGGN